MELILKLIGLAVAGVIIGILSGLLGIGGGTVMVPTLRLVFGLPAMSSTATSLFSMIFSSISGSITHIRQKTCIPLLGVILGVGGAFMSPLGVQLAAMSPTWAIMLAAALIIGYSAFNMLKKALKMPSAKKAKAAVQEAGKSDAGAAAKPVPQVEDEAYQFTAKRVVGAVAVGLIAGLCAGYIGVGGGFIMVPMMTSFLAVSMRKASGTSLIAIIILSIPGVITQAMLGNVDFVAGIALAVGSIPGAVIGAKFVKKVPERQLRFLFAIFLFIAAVVLLLNEFSVL